jgi:glycosyltransferase involved in cell wall biosynthesis
MSMAARKILYIEHAGSFGGSCVSLRCMLERLDLRRYTPVVALTRPGAALRSFYAGADVEVVDAPGIERFEHTTAEWASLTRPDRWPQAVRTLTGWRRSRLLTLELVSRVTPALVHLNSAVLLPSASALHDAGIPFVWHVRESPVEGHVSLRSRLLRRALRDWPEASLYLSDRARQLWHGGARGVVAGEFVAVDRFDPSLDGGAARRRLGLSADDRVVLYVGGIASIKGIVPLLEALALARSEEPRLVCLMPGARLERPSTFAYAVAERLLPLVGRTTLTARVAHDLARFDLGSACRMTPFSGEMPDLLAASDLLVFPALADHFSRPVAEAGAMKKPVVASRFPTTEGQVQHGITGLLVEPDAPTALASAILQILRDPGRAAAMGRAGHDLALAHDDATTNTARMMRIYDEILAGIPRASK